MKIVAGLGSVDEYERFVKAGADEFFCGYVPYEWSKKYGTVMPLNRREVLSYNVQIGAFSEMEILAEMVKEYGCPVHLTFNSLYYIPEQYPEIAEIIKKCKSIGFLSYIIADPALIVYLRKMHIDCEIHLSGETSEVNSGMVEYFSKMQLKRVIFHRKNTLEDMESVISHNKMEFEAFALNELCQFSGAFCNSLHCDEMGYLCRVPYRLSSRFNVKRCENVNKRKTEMSVITAENLEEADGNITDNNGYLCGKTGCGLCALYKMQKVGITHLKLVGRGNYTDFMENDIRNLRTALNILQNSRSENDYISNMKKKLFPYGCSENCYYNR